MIGPALIAEIGRALAPTGELYVMTDIFTLALEAMAALETSELFESARGPLVVRPGQPVRREVAS